MDHRLALVRPTLRMGPRALACRARAWQLAWRREMELPRRWGKRECRQATRPRRAWLPCLSSDPGGQEEEREEPERDTTEESVKGASGRKEGEKREEEARRGEVRLYDGWS